tara:strand:- start:2016 stop:2492 length:477 start_codon:yes stop_codon:yes gene_type:complete
MAIANVQDYLNLAISLIVSNKSGTDASYSLPNDLRKLSNIKVKNHSVVTKNMAAGVIGETIQRDYVSPTFLLVIWDHPVAITHINDQELGTSRSKALYTNFYISFRDRVGATNMYQDLLKFDNILDSTTNPPYNALDTAPWGETTAGKFTVVQLEFEA